jgi:hypothetical protein
MQSLHDSLLIGLVGLSALLVSNPLPAEHELAPARSTSSVSVVEASALTQESKAITSTNWQQHPKIKTVRSIVESVNAGLRKGVFKISVRRFACEELRYDDSERKMAVDSKGVVRWYQKFAGGEDSSLNWEHYYDEAGRLRFVLISGRALTTDLTKLEHRVYFDESGKRIWEEHKYVQRTAYSFPEVWPDDQNRKPDDWPPIQKSDPAKAFAATSPCPEIKSGGRRSRK